MSSASVIQPTVIGNAPGYQSANTQWAQFQANLQPGSNTSSTGQVGSTTNTSMTTPAVSYPFKVMLLTDLLAKSLFGTGIAVPYYCRNGYTGGGITGYQIVTPSGGVTLDNTGTKYYATGDVILPIPCANNSNNQLPTLPNPTSNTDLNGITVLFVSADPKYSTVVSNWTWSADTRGDGYPNGFSLMYTGGRYAISGPNGLASALGDAIENGYSQTSLSNGRVIAAVYNQYLINLTPDNNSQFTINAKNIGNFSAKFFAPFSIASNMHDGYNNTLYNAQNGDNNSVQLGAYHAVWTITRSTVYSNFIVVANGQPQSADDNEWQFMDVLPLVPAIGGCCSNNGIYPNTNCGPFTGGNGLSVCGSYIQLLGPTAVFSNPTWQAYIQQNPGQFDSLMTTACSSTAGKGTDICSCQPGSLTLDPTLPAVVQQFIQSNPACYNPTCNKAGYKMSNQLNSNCSLAFQQCLQAQNLSNAGAINGTPQLNSVINCALNNSASGSSGNTNTNTNSNTSGSSSGVIGTPGTTGNTGAGSVIPPVGAQPPASTTVNQSSTPGTTTTTSSTNTASVIVAILIILFVIGIIMFFLAHAHKSAPVTYTMMPGVMPGVMPGSIPQAQFIRPM